MFLSAIIFEKDGDLNNLESVSQEVTTNIETLEAVAAWINNMDKGIKVIKKGSIEKGRKDVIHYKETKLEAIETLFKKNTIKNIEITWEERAIKYIQFTTYSQRICTNWYYFEASE